MCVPCGWSQRRGYWCKRSQQSENQQGAVVDWELNCPFGQFRAAWSLISTVSTNYFLFLQLHPVIFFLPQKLWSEFMLRIRSCRQERSRLAWRQCCWSPAQWSRAPSVCPGSAGTTPAWTPTHRWVWQSPVDTEREKKQRVNTTIVLAAE